MRILIVDDIADNLRVLSSVLVDEGHQVSAATNGRQALRLAASAEPDLILLDVTMPDMDGYAVCEALKADPRLSAIPVIFVTARTEVEDETRGLALGAVDYIAKPFKDAVVRMRVRTQLELKRQRDLLERLCHLDGLTGIANRRALDERLDVEWRRSVRSGEPLAVLMIDVDLFKRYNDVHGHLAGDDCLRRVAATLNAGLRRSGDFVARYGGEEFCCVLSTLDHASHLRAAERLRTLVEGLRIPHGSSDVSPWVTVSIGGAFCHPIQGQDPAALVAAADRQLFAAKELGRNRVCLGGD